LEKEKNESNFKISQNISANDIIVKKIIKKSIKVFKNRKLKKRAGF